MNNLIQPLTQEDFQPEILKSRFPWIQAAAISCIGGRADNQDCCGMADTCLGFLATVCDGMGGGPGGATASRIAVNEIVASVKSLEKSGESRINVLLKSIRQANVAIRGFADDHPELRGMGSTCTVLLLNEESAIIAHVGDSRVYQLRGHSKVFRTFDHSLVFQLVSNKVISEEQARLSEQSNIITRALGIKPEVDVDIIERPFVKGDRFVLTTDGLHGSMPEREFIKLVTKDDCSPSASTQQMARQADMLGRSLGGGHDNLTIAIVDVTTNSKLKDPMIHNYRIIIFVLTALLLISVAVNFFQCCSLPPVRMVCDSIGNVYSVWKTDTIDSVCLAGVKRQHQQIQDIKEKSKEDSLYIMNLQMLNDSIIKSLKESIDSLHKQNEELKRRVDVLKSDSINHNKTTTQVQKKVKITKTKK